MAGQSIGERAARSTGYLLFRRLVGYAIRFSTIAVLARKLSVAEFGVVAIAATCINIMVMFGSAGINSWVIYDREPGWEERTKSAWWLNTVLTIGQVAVACALIPFVASFFHDAELAPVLVVLAATFFIEQMDEVPDALLERNLDFRKVATRDLVYDFLTGAGGVGMALAGVGLWSLVLPRLLLSPVFVIVTMRLARWTPGWRLFRKDWKRIFKYTIHLIGSNLLHVLTNNGDTIVVGKLLGDVGAAFYNTAYMLANLMGRSVTTVIVQVSMPALAKIREKDTDQLAPTCIRMYRLLAMVTTPALIGVFALANDLVLAVYGGKWHAVVPLLRVFIIFTLVRSITSPSGAVFRVAGRTDLNLKGFLILTPLIFAGIGVGSLWGATGVAVGVTTARVFSGFLMFAWSLSLAGARVGTGFKALVPSTVSAVAMAILVSATRFGLLKLGTPFGVRLAVCVPLGAVTYLMLLRTTAGEAFVEVARMLTKLSPRLKPLLLGRAR